MQAAKPTSQIAINPPVFAASAGFLLLFLGFGVFIPEQAARFAKEAQELVGTYFGWVYILSASFFVVFSIFIAAGPWAHVRLGQPDERPAYSYPTWFSMLFSAGMGIGLLFYGVAEPMYHYGSPPMVDPRSPEAAAGAVPLTFFHWGFHAWAIYVVLGLSIAFFTYRKGLPLSIRSVLYPLLKDRIYGWPGHVVDTVAVIGTLFGLATSLGLGAMQVNAGLHELFGIPKGQSSQVVIIAVITGVATLSLVSGVDKGIRRLSELNIGLACLLLVFVFLVGPTQYVLDAVVHDFGIYLSTFVERSFDMSPRGNPEWRRAWTLFYWGWWIAWAPFVGTFVARVSRGRTVREFVLGVCLVPPLVTFLWLGIFGETALYLETNTSASIAQAVDEDISTAIYVLLAELPLSSLNSGLACLVVVIFFVTSSDSASFVVDMITSGGHPNPPIWQRVFWAVTEGAVAAVLLVTAGKSGLAGLQAGVICVGAPFCIVLLFTCWGLLKALRAEIRGSEEM